MLVRKHIIMFLVMVAVGMAFNPMNVLAYRLGDIYLSLTLLYGGLLMASNMMWAHELVHYLDRGMFNPGVFWIGILLSLAVSVLLLREQLYVSEDQWLKRMIGHHSTALTTSHKLLKSSVSPMANRLATNIIMTQEREIAQMKGMLRS